MASTTLSALKSNYAYNLQTLRSNPLAEISGSLGDLGTLLPFLIALTRTSSISLPSTLVFTGLANILTGFIFGLPLPVQPMKAIGAHAIANHFSVQSTISAGIFVASLVGLLSITGALRLFAKYVPVPVVKGIQVGAGLSLILSAGASLLQTLSWTRPAWTDNRLWALAAFVALILSQHSPRMPYALFFFILGLIFAFTHIPPYYWPFPHIWVPHVFIPTPKTFLHASISAGLSQLPLTILNSIVAVTHLSSDLLPSRPAPTETALGLSIATINLISCWFGAMPTCHGSGGLAAQYRFGARSGASVIILGIFKLLLGLFLGSSLASLLEKFPKAFLGILVIAAGLELAKVGESINTTARDLWSVSPGMGEESEVIGLSDEERKQRFMTMLVTTGGLLAFKNDAVGFLAGMAWHYSYRLPLWWEHRRGGGVRLP